MFALAFDDLRHRLLEKHGVREDAVEHGLLAHKGEAKRREGKQSEAKEALLFQFSHCPIQK